MTDAYALITTYCTDGLKLMMFYKFCSTATKILYEKGNSIIINKQYIILTMGVAKISFRREQIKIRFFIYLYYYLQIISMTIVLSLRKIKLL